MARAQSPVSFATCWWLVQVPDTTTASYSVVTIVSAKCHEEASFKQYCSTIHTHSDIICLTHNTSLVICTASQHFSITDATTPFRKHWLQYFMWTIVQQITYSNWPGNTSADALQKSRHNVFRLPCWGPLLHQVNDELIDQMLTKRYWAKLVVPGWNWTNEVKLTQVNTDGLHQTTGVWPCAGPPAKLRKHLYRLIIQQPLQCTQLYVIHFHHNYHLLTISQPHLVNCICFMLYNSAYAYSHCEKIQTSTLYSCSQIIVTVKDSNSNSEVLGAKRRILYYLFTLLVPE